MTSFFGLWSHSPESQALLKGTEVAKKQLCKEGLYTLWHLSEYETPVSKFCYGGLI